jgi:hypothetical protein
MKRNGHIALVLQRMIALPILASAIVCRGGGSPSVDTTLRVSELPPLDTEDARKHSPIIGNLPSAAGSKQLRFQVFKVRGHRSIDELESQLGADLFMLVLKINRLDRKHIRSGELLVIPDANAGPMSVSPFPLKLEVVRSIPKFVLVSRGAQAFGAYEFGELVRWGPTSTGKKSTPTSAGLFHTNWRARETRSSVNASWVLPWCFNIDNSSGVSFHQFDLPGYPASHGCVRLFKEDAKWIYDWAEPWMLSQSGSLVLAYGTPVVVFGDYSYGGNPPWKRLADDPLATSISVAEIDKALNKYVATISDRARLRESLIAQLAQKAD